MYIKYRYAILAALSLMMVMVGSQKVFSQQSLSQLVINHALYDIAWSPNGERLAVALDTGIGIYTDTLQEVSQLQTEILVIQLSWSADSNWLASISINDGTINIWRWDTTSNEFILDRTLTNSHGYPFVSAVSWSPDGRKLAVLVGVQPPGSATIIGTVEIWDTQSWTFQNSLLSEHEFSAWGIQWSADSTRIAGGANVCIASEFFSCGVPYFYVADAMTGETLFLSEIYLADLHALAWSSNNKLAVGDEPQILIFDTTLNQTTAIFDNEAPDGYGILDLDWSSDGKKLVTGNFRGGLIEVIDTETGTILLQFNTGGLNALDLSPDDSKLATINTTAGLVEIWDVSALPSSAGTSTLTPYPSLTPSFTPDLPTPTP